MAETGKGHRQRLKERFLAGEPRAGTDEALLELLLTYAIPQKDVQPLAARLLVTFGTLPAVLAADLPALCAVDGIGEHAATLLRLTARIGRNHTSPPRTVTSVLPPTKEVAPRAKLTAVSHTPAQMGIAPEEASGEGTRWRAGGPYTAANASKAGLIEETRLALLANARLRDLAAARRELLDGGLPQRSRATREVIVRVIQDRLVAWRPPPWVCKDLTASVEAPDTPDFPLLLLLHAARQDALLYDVARAVIWPRRQEGLGTISRVDVQRFLDQALPSHAEIDGWSVATREKLAGNLLTILRDYGLLQGAQGSATKRIVEPVVSPRAAAHLARLLTEEGIDAAALYRHDDWRIWLLDPPRAQALVTAAGEGVAR